MLTIIRLSMKMHFELIGNGRSECIIDWQQKIGLGAYCYIQ